MEGITSFIENSGAWVYVLAPLFMVVVAILPIPAEIPAMVNGMAFGANVGTAITWSGAFVGALISFELSRRYGRPLGKKVLPPSAFDRADRLALSAGWPGLLVLRLVPIVAFTVINWAAGLTRIPRWTFLWTTALGILPGAILFTFSGMGLGWFYRQNPELTPVLVGLGLVVVWITIRRMRRGSHPSALL